MKPSTPKGTRDFSPAEMVRRNYIFDTIKNIFQKYGFLPLETPAMENLETLTGKYGDEGDKLIFKILNSGNYLEYARVRKHVIKDIAENNCSKLDRIEGEHYPLQLIATPKELLPYISEKALRYDLTVPFARYVVQHQHEITFPFKRYQIQPVWRADRPQKGRYREFYQCDADIIGSNSLLNEADLITVFDDVFTRLNFPVTIKINNRKILTGIAEYVGHPDKIIDITVAIDKLDKIGAEKVGEELISKGLDREAIEKVQSLINLKGTITEKTNYLKLILRSEVGKKGIDELEELLEIARLSLLNKAAIEFDITLARGLNYYTGTIFEVKADNVSMGSICGGGRYDDLTGIFGLPGISGVGISFGADRIYDVMEELKLFPDFSNITTKILFVNFGKEEERYCLPIGAILRRAGINTEIYPDSVKMKKQMSYADSKGIPFVALVGSEEMRTGQITIKNMKTGDQEKLTLEEIITRLS